MLVLYDVTTLYWRGSSGRWVPGPVVFEGTLPGAQISVGLLTDQYGFSL